MITPEIVCAAYRQHGTLKATAEALGIATSTAHAYIKRGSPEILRPAGGQFRATRPLYASPPVNVPALPDGEIGIDALWSRLIEDYEHNAARRAAVSWMPIGIPTAGPIALLVFGDPHLGAHGFNAPLFLRHCEICRTVPHVYGVGVGDNSNNWVGNLARLYADQGTSRAQENRLVRWFLRESGVRFAFCTAGNHDYWNQGTVIQEAIADGHTFIADWEARVRLTFADGAEIKVHAAHDFPGHSMWNPGHGLVRAALMTSDADLYVAGHKHCAALQFVERPDNSVAWIVRARGYKEDDPYAKQKGFSQNRSCAGVLVVLDPGAVDPTGRVQVFPDVDAGIRQLIALRSHYEQSRRRPAAKAEAAKPAATAATPGDRPSRGDRRRKNDTGKTTGRRSRLRDPAVRGAAQADARPARRSRKTPVRQPAGKGGAAAAPGRKKRA